MVARIKDRGAIEIDMKTPLTDKRATQIIRLDKTVEVVPARFARDMERDIRHLLLRLYMDWEDDPLSFAIESAGVMEKWEPEIKKMLRGEA